MTIAPGPGGTAWGPRGALGRALWIAPSVVFVLVLVAGLVWPGFAQNLVGVGIALMAAAVVIGVIGVTHGLRHRSASPIAVEDSRQVRGVSSRRRSRTDDAELSDQEADRLVAIAHGLGRQTTAGVINAVALVLFWVGYALTSSSWLVLVLIVAAVALTVGVGLMLRDLGRLRRFVQQYDRTRTQGR